MMEVPVVVHPRVSARHPEIEEEDAIHAWVYAVECAERVDSPYWPAYAALGYDKERETAGTPCRAPGRRQHSHLSRDDSTFKENDDRNIWT